MAKEYKEGVDFEWVDAKDSKGNVVKDGRGKPVKTRRFFKKSEKDAMKSSPRPKARPDNKSPKAAGKPVTKDAMKGYRAGDVTSSRIPAKTGGRGDGGAEVVRRAADRALTNAKPEKEKRIPGRALLRAFTEGGNPKNYLDAARGMAKGGLVKKPAKTYKK